MTRLLTRRDFCAGACRAASGLAAGVAASACGGSPTGPSGSGAPALAVINATVVNGTITLVIASGSPLSNVGGAARVATSSVSVLVSRVSEVAFTALTAICTHEGCTITGFQNARYVCPCHGSRFTTSGTVASGPASQPLKSFATQFAGDTLVITL
jgi:cytochrome b6-f complex iron-sulfur subunit